MENSVPIDFSDQLPSLQMVTHVGHVRKRNEDTVGGVEDIGLVVIADGMGGHTEGAKASKIAVDETIKSFVAGNSLVESIRSADRALQDYIKINPDSQGMGTTVIAAKVDGIDYEIAWVGDSRAYFWHGNLKRLTQDHSLVQRRINSGAITQDEETVQKDRNILEKALMGIGIEDHEIGRVAGRIYKDELLILCTDGLHGMATDAEIAAVIQSTQAIKLAHQLINLALKKGGDDNVSVAVVTQPEVVKRRPEVSETIEIPIIEQRVKPKKRWAVIILLVVLAGIIGLVWKWVWFSNAQVLLDPQRSLVVPDRQVFHSDINEMEK